MAILTSLRTPRRRALAHLALAALAAALALACTPMRAWAQQVAQRDELKAAFVFQFANFVQWQDASFKDASAPLVIGIVGNEQMVKTLDASVRGKTVGTRSIQVVSISDAKSVGGCHILFIDSSDDKRVDTYLASARGKSILTVSDDDDFTAEGGVIRLFEKDNKLRFEVNVDEAQRASLTISSKLLGLAQIVHDKH
jgi:hypothetical protein